MNKVRDLRTDRLMTQAELARKAGLAIRTVFSVEKGARCAMTTKRKLLLALGLKFEDRLWVFPS